MVVDLASNKIRLTCFRVNRVSATLNRDLRSRQTFCHDPKSQALFQHEPFVPSADRQAQVKMTLCDRCSTISTTQLMSKEGHILHLDLHRLYDNAPTCELCALLLLYLRRAIEKHKSKIAGHESDKYLAAIASLEAAAHGTTVSARDTESLMPITLHYTQDYEFRVRKGSSPPPLRQRSDQTSSLSVLCGHHHHAGFYLSTDIQIYVHPGDALQFLGIQVRDRLAPNSMDPKIVAKVKEWMECCAANHSECQIIDRGPDPNPRRLLDLRDTNGTQTYQIIDVPADFKHEYVALSYCWGKVPQSWIKYIRQVQHSTTKMIERRLMPQTVQDAITSCLALGYLYLWVDGLCIIQGDTTDWLQESARMDRIFANAAIVVSASATANCEDGFLAPRSQLQQQGVVVPLKVKHDYGEETSSNLHLCLPDSDYEWAAAFGAVFGRGWCLQERQLASRILHVCQDNVTFECILCRRFESEILPMDDFDIYSERYRTHIPVEKFRRNNPKPSGGAQSILMWYATVEDYTLRRLTMNSDKLIAISGLAKRAHTDLGGLYLAGLWQKQLHIGLAWQVVDLNSSGDGQAVMPKVLSTRASVYTAPSWSWASIDGPVNWQLIDGFVQSDDGFLTSAIELLDHKIDLVGPDPFGPVKYAEITIAGPLLSIPVEILLRNELLTFPDWMGGRFPGKSGWYIEDESETIKVDEILCLKIGTRPFGPGPSIPPTNEMLVLERVSSRTTKGSEKALEVYRRVGFGQILETSYFDDAPVVKMVLV